MGSPPEVNGHRGATVRYFVDLARRMMLYGVALGVGIGGTAAGLAGVALRDQVTLEVGIALAVCALVLIVGVALWPRWK